MQHVSTEILKFFRFSLCIQGCSWPSWPGKAFQALCRPFINQLDGLSWISPGFLFLFISFFFIYIFFMFFF